MRSNEHDQNVFLNFFTSLFLEILRLFSHNLMILFSIFFLQFNNFFVIEFILNIITTFFLET